MPTPTVEITAAEICATVAVLAHDSLEGREAGRPGSAKAARWLSSRFAEIGLTAPQGGHLRPFTFPTGVRSYPHALHEPGSARDTTANIVGWVPGRDPVRREEAVLVGAHYDHLGWGGFGSLAPGRRAIHNGADDNASGVAGVLELAQRIVADPPARTVVFVLFGAEELGTLGSQRYVESPDWPLEKTVAMVNLDMVGRLRRTLTVFGTGTSTAWPKVLAGLEPGPGWTIRTVPDGFGPSDHASFYGAGVPVLMFFTGPHEQYHRPDDDLVTIDAAGEVEVLERVEAVVRRAGDGRSIPYAEAPETQPRPMAFKVALGVLPDYGFEGPGLRLSGIRPGGPAERAGLEAGDVIVRLAGAEIGDVYDYMEILADLEAETAVPVRVERDGRAIDLTVTPESR
ncbi:MAG TPA: M20/M25/M40 family metallo-hydrolase [Gemmatimonadota bacterium]|nr:M20/M25/M40 family metallo-hydrolase [Gemmatimonadota bacterium]